MPSGNGDNNNNTDGVDLSLDQTSAGTLLERLRMTGLTSYEIMAGLDNLDRLEQVFYCYTQNTHGFSG